MPPAPPRQHVEDMVELVEEILLRLPPDEPDSLVRAAVVCKPWRRLLSSHRFRRLYRDLHKTPPMLGFFHNYRWLGFYFYRDYLATEESLLTLAFTKGFLPRDPDGWYTVLDCRHGRVLLKSWEDDDDENDNDGVSKYVVWDPMTGSQTPVLTPVQCSGADDKAAVLCAVGGCDHGACHMGPFLVVYLCVDTDEEGEEGAWVFVYSSKTRKWTERAFLQLRECLGYCMDKRPIVLVAQALYSFIQGETRQVIKYDLGHNSISVFNVPPMVADRTEIPPALLTAEDGGLGLARVDKFSLNLWSYNDGVAEWMLG
ncbi:hypothetical protein ACQ4PT_044522 [Festuca glaucescens]